MLKQSQNKKVLKFVWAAPKIVSFFTAGIWEKDIIFVVQLKQIFGPSYIYFDRTLEKLENYYVQGKTKTFTYSPK